MWIQFKTIYNNYIYNHIIPAIMDWMFIVINNIVAINFYWLIKIQFLNIWFLNFVFTYKMAG